jgi:glycosyltransferase XagB
MQTYLVHMRNTRGIFADMTPQNFFIFQLMLGGKVASMILNPLMWAMTLAYFLFRPTVGLFIESLFPTPVLYMGVTCLLFGNFLYAYYYMLGAAKQDHWENVYIALFMPFYWFGISIAAVYAGWELMTRPFYWHKTKHGLHLTQDDNQIPVPKGAIAVMPAVQ